MVTFDLTDVLENSELTTSSKDIQDLLYRLSVQSANYVSNVYNLRTGKKPNEGALLSDTGNEYVVNFINELITNDQNGAEWYLENLYTDNVFQVLIASGIIPVGWLYKTRPHHAKVYMDNLRKIWEMILSNYGAPGIRAYIPRYTMINHFGMLTYRAVGHTEENLCWFIIPRTQPDMDFFTKWIDGERIKNVILIQESKYPEYLVNDNYTFLFKFDKIVSAHTGVCFKLSTELTKTIPSYPVKIGCDRMCFFTTVSESVQYSVVTNRYLSRDIKRGEVVTETVSLPNTHTIGLVSLNGISYFVGTANAAAAGISIVETEKQMLTGYKTYEVSVSGITGPTTIFIDGCEDFTGRSTTKKLICSKKSKIDISDSDVTVQLVFNRPFIFLDTEKIKVYARKDDMSQDELIESIEVLADGYRYVERKAVFGTTESSTHASIGPCCNDRKPIPQPSGSNTCVPCAATQIGMGPDVKMYCHKPPYYYPDSNVPKEIAPEARAILYGVSECGVIVLSFDGYTDYKYFHVVFEDRAMISTYSISGQHHTIDIIPNIEDFFITNPEYRDNGNDDSIESTNPDESNGSDDETTDNDNDTADDDGTETGNGGTEEGVVTKGEEDLD